MPRAAWSSKDERMYGHIRTSCLSSRGKRAAKTCTRIAAATVNKQRASEGRTLSGVRKPTIYEALREKLGREPTNAELKADVERIKREAYEEMASHGKLPHQRRRRAGRLSGIQGTHKRPVWLGALVIVLVALPVTWIATVLLNRKKAA